MRSVYYETLLKVGKYTNGEINQKLHVNVYLKNATCGRTECHFRFFFRTISPFMNVHIYIFCSISTFFFYQ